jgi:SH3-like domain-containing protein
MRRCRVKSVHKSQFCEALIADPGDAVQVGKGDDEYPGWVWCTDSNGISAWVPENFLKMSGNGGIMLRDYNSLELNVEIGEILEVIDQESGWLLCINSDGSIGWVPAKKVVKIS